MEEPVKIKEIKLLYTCPVTKENVFSNPRLTVYLKKASSLLHEVVCEDCKQIHFMKIRINQ